MPNHVACERRKGGEHWRGLSTFAESAQSRVVTRMPNQELRHHTALYKSGINSRHGHGEEAAFAELFCGMLRPDVLYALMQVSTIYTPPPYTVHSPDSAVLNLAESECV